MSIELARLQEIIVEAADMEIMPRFRKIESDGMRTKSSAIDLVTDADEQAEWRIRDAVKKAYPKALFVGEESVARDASLLDKIGEADLAVIIDPVDGTGNFAWGLPLFGVLCAVVAKGETVGGLIYDPIGRDWIAGEKGSGAWRIAADGSKTRQATMKAAPVDQMIGISSWYLLEDPLRTKVAGNLAKTHASFSYRCAAYEYRLLIGGNCHFGFFPKLMPWDHAAGLLLHTEAGGFSACFDGTPYLPSKHKGGVLVAPDKTSWKALHTTLLS